MPVRVEHDDMIVSGRRAGELGGGRVRTLTDHRLAMSAVVLGLAAGCPVTVDDMGQVGTGFPGFVGLMNRLGAGLVDAGAADAHAADIGA